MKKHISTILLILMFLTGLSLLLYPTVSDYWNSLHQSQAIASYEEAVENLDDDTYDRMLESAVDYNKKLFEKPFGLYLEDSEVSEYNSQLNVNGTGIMSYIIIDKINCKYPIYHGTDPAVLEVAIGHLNGTSLPVGGESTHCVLSGHRGLPSAQLFSKLDELEVGDRFILQTMGETLTYEVDKISIVLPDEVDSLKIVEGEDLCTLVTCTPYGINTHRLLVRGHRVANEDKSTTRVTSEAVQIEPMIIAPIFAVPLLILLLLWLLFGKKRDKSGEQHETEEAHGDLEQPETEEAHGDHEKLEKHEADIEHINLE